METATVRDECGSQKRRKRGCLCQVCVLDVPRFYYTWSGVFGVDGCVTKDCLSG